MAPHVKPAHIAPEHGIPAQASSRGPRIPDPHLAGLKGCITGPGSPLSQEEMDGIIVRAAIESGLPQ